MRPEEVGVSASARDLLPGADFADAFRLVVDDPALDAEAAAYRAMSQPPGWVAGLMWLRDLIVRPVGLRTRHDRTIMAATRIGAFPVLSRGSRRVVLGLDDRHLDFRVAIDVSAVDERRREVVATTLVRTHNLPGRMYLAIILPFHQRIVPGIMARVAGP